MKPVTVTLRAYEPPPKPDFKKGQIINLGWSKRIKAVVEGIDENVPYATTLNLRSGYLAAPKSKLRRKTVFSKINNRILNPLNQKQ